MKQSILISLIILLPGCDLDESPPLAPIQVRGYFTMSEPIARINIAWEAPLNDDVKEYHIFKSKDNGLSFDSLGLVLEPNTLFSDTSITWMESFGYKVRAKDYSTNIGEFSETIFIKCFKPGGKWSLLGFDSTELCINPITYQTEESFQVNMQSEFINDTLRIMDFPSIQLDTNTWNSNGWMYLTLKILIPSNDSLILNDTLTYSNTISPEYYSINLENPEEGKISFTSGLYNDINLVHTLKSCTGIELLP